MNKNLLRKNIYNICLVFISLILFSCSEEIIVENNSESVVVTAFLYEGEPVENIQITKSLPLGSEDTVGTPINDAVVELLKDQIKYNLVLNLDTPGYYKYSGNDLEISSGDLFSIVVNYNDITITSETIVPLKPQNVSISNNKLLIEELDFSSFSGRPPMFEEDSNSILITWDNIDSSLYYVVIENIETNPASIYSDRPFAMVNRFISSPARTREYSINRRTVTHFGDHNAIVYKVNQEYADLYETRNQDSRNLNEPLTNIENGLGVFSSFASDTVSFKVNQN